MKGMSESQLQKQIFQWMSLQHPEIRKYAFHVPNGGYRNAKEAANFARQGVTPGVPDIVVLYPTKRFHGLLIELKSKDGKLTIKQQVMIGRLNEAGYRVTVCKTLDEVIEVFKDYFKGEVFRHPFF